MEGRRQDVELRRDECAINASVCFFLMMMMMIVEKRRGRGRLGG